MNYINTYLLFSECEGCLSKVSTLKKGDWIRIGFYGVIQEKTEEHHGFVEIVDIIDRHVGNPLTSVEILTKGGSYVQKNIADDIDEIYTVCVNKAGTLRRYKRCEVRDLDKMEEVFDDHQYTTIKEL